MSDAASGTAPGSGSETVAEDAMEARPGPPPPRHATPLWGPLPNPPPRNAVDRALVATIRSIDALSELVGRAVSWLTTVLVLLVCANVFLRYGMNRSSVALQELQWYLFALIFLLGAAYTLKHDRHVRVDILYQKLPPRGKALVDLLGALVLLLPFCALVAQAGFRFARVSYRDHEVSPDAGIPGFWLIKAAIPAGFGLLALQGLSMALRALRVLILGEPPAADPEDAEREGL